MINPDALGPLLKSPDGEHWRAAARGSVSVSHCGDCGHHWFPSSRVCPRCLGDHVQWQAVSGRATLWSWCEFHKAYFKGTRELVPYVVVLAELEEGPKLYGNLLGTAPDDLKIGMRLEAAFTPAGDDAAMINFKAVTP